MNQLKLVCLSLTPNLRCVGFTLGQFIALIIPPAIEVIVSLLFIYLYSGPARRAQLCFAVDGILYFIWALLDMLSHVVPVARTSLSVFKGLDLFVGAVSFTPILTYSFYLYQLSFRDSIPTLPRKIQPYLEVLLLVLLVIAVAINEVSSFVGTYLGASFNQPIVIMFANNNESTWLSLSQSSLTIYTIIQFLFFLLAFSRLSRVFLDQRRTELTHSDEHRSLCGIAWITAGIVFGVIETLAGFSQVSFGVALARRILRLVARATLMFGLLKGLDAAESFRGELDGGSRISRGISRILGINPHPVGSFHRIPRSHSQQLRADGCSAEKQPREERVTVHYEKGQAPFLQIRFSTLDFPVQALLHDTTQAQNRRRSLSGLIPGSTSVGGVQQHRDNISDEMATMRTAMLGTRRAKSELVTADGRHPDWAWLSEKDRRRESVETISDTRSIVRDLERKFPSLPPRVTGKYRGSILGQNYEEDPYPVVGISRQSSIRRDGAHNPNEDGAPSVTLSPSNSVKRKPAPPLLENIAQVSDRSKRPVSTWGGLTQSTAHHLIMDSPASPVTPTSPGPDGVVVDNPSSALTGEPITPRSRKMTTRNLFKRASRALSDASIRSAEWLASASSPHSSRAPLTAADIEMYRRGNSGPGSARPTPLVGGPSLSNDNLLPKAG